MSISQTKSMLKRTEYLQEYQWDILLKKEEREEVSIGKFYRTKKQTKEHPPDKETLAKLTN